MRVYLVAGEASGDQLGAALMVGLKELTPGVEFFGVGGSLMQAQGMTSLFGMNELSVMGIAEILPKYRHFKRRIAQTADDILAHKPDVLITIDSPDFCLRVAKRVKAASKIRTVHYVAPSVWAWRAGRAQKMARYVDQVLALLPFEPPYMHAAGMRCDFVGHPVSHLPEITATQTANFRREQSIGGAPFILVLPGSRQGEVARLSPVFGAALTLVLAKNPDARVMVVAAPPVADAVQAATSHWAARPITLDPSGLSPRAAQLQKRIAFASADVALAASGTVSLELAAAATPTVIAYKLNWLSWQIMSRMVRVDTVTLVNLVTGSRSVPEFLGRNCQPAAIATALIELMNNDALKKLQRDAMRETMTLLGRGGPAPGSRAANAVLDGMRDEP
jgi:lipid-A-disaccharide synthase